MDLSDNQRMYVRLRSIVRFWNNETIVVRWINGNGPPFPLVDRVHPSFRCHFLLPKLFFNVGCLWSSTLLHDLARRLRGPYDHYTNLI